MTVAQFLISANLIDPRFPAHLAFFCLTQARRVKSRYHSVVHITEYLYPRATMDYMRMWRCFGRIKYFPKDSRHRPPPPPPFSLNAPWKRCKCAPFNRPIRLTQPTQLPPSSQKTNGITGYFEGPSSIVLMISRRSSLSFTYCIISNDSRIR